MDTPSERLKSVRVKRGFETAAEAAKSYGWNVNSYSSHENGNRGIPPEAAIKYSIAFRFTLDWLYKGATKDRGAGVDATPHIAFKLVPRLLWNYTRKYGGLEKAMAEATEFTSLPKTLELPMLAFSMKVAGDSMRSANSPDSFKDGDEVVFSTGAEIKPGDYVIAEIEGEATVVFRQYMERGRGADGFMTFELAPLNPAYRSYTIVSPDQARLVAKMVHAIKSYL